MIIAGDSGSFTTTGTQFDDFTDIEQSSTRTSGGSTRTIRAGERFIVVENIRITGAEWKELKDILLDGSEDYFYTPTVVPDYMSSTDFPMPVEIGTPKKQSIDKGGVKMYRISLKIIGADYL